MYRLQPARVQAVILFVLVVLSIGCGRIMSVDYQPNNPWKGQGTLTIVPFLYDAAEDHRVRPRQVETPQSAKTDLFLSQPISLFFTEALRGELVHAGYTVQDSSQLSISGNLSRFYLDWRSGMEQSFELQALFLVKAGEQIVFEWTCSSVQTGPTMLGQDGILIRTGTADCMKRFIQAAQEKKVL